MCGAGQGQWVASCLLASWLYLPKQKFLVTPVCMIPAPQAEISWGRTVQCLGRCPAHRQFYPYYDCCGFIKLSTKVGNFQQINPRACEREDGTCMSRSEARGESGEQISEGSIRLLSSFLGSIGPWSLLICFLELDKSVWDGSSYRLRAWYQSFLKENNHYCLLLWGFWIMSESVVKILGAHKLRTPLENRVKTNTITLIAFGSFLFRILHCWSSVKGLATCLEILAEMTVLS